MCCLIIVVINILAAPRTFKQGHRVLTQKSRETIDPLPTPRNILSRHVIQLRFALLQDILQRISKRCWWISNLLMEFAAQLRGAARPARARWPGALSSRADALRALVSRSSCPLAASPPLNAGTGAKMKMPSQPCEVAGGDCWKQGMTMRCSELLRAHGDHRGGGRQGQRG